MEVLAQIQTAPFWSGLLAVVWVNVVLSSDNAVVIALAVRSLPGHHRNKALAWGTAGIVALRIILTMVTVEVLKVPLLKIAGAALLFWIAIKLLLPEDGEKTIESSDQLIRAVKTILLADLVMSLDNFIAVAAAAKGSMLLLVLGLVISIPPVIFGATVIVKLMERFPIIIAVGAALIGWVAGEMLVTDPLVQVWVAANLPWMETRLPFGIEVSWAQITGAAFVVGTGKWLASRSEAGGGKTG